MKIELEMRINTRPIGRLTISYVLLMQAFKHFSVLAILTLLDTSLKTIHVIKNRTINAIFTALNLMAQPFRPKI